MQPQCTNCGAFTRRSFHHEEDYQSSVLLERLRTSNFPATDEEISHIRLTILPSISDDISSIDSKVASLHAAIRSMEEERERLTNVQRKYSNLISSHRTFPSEIWSEIFLYTQSYAFDSNAYNASGPIWRLSHVCQRWRSIALSLHSFWSTVHLHFPNAAKQEADVQHLETVIQRSGQGLLNIMTSVGGDISDGHSNPDSNPSILTRMLDMIFAQSCRWREAHLSFSGRGGNIRVYAPLHNRLPRLESLTIYFAPFQLEEESVVSIFEDCPRLTKATFGGAIPPVVKLPWHQLTELNLSPMNFEESDEEERRACMGLIELCPSLETLSLPSWDLEDDDEPYTPITCSNMYKLDATSVPVIDALTLPGLREASFHPDPAAARYDALYSFQQLLIRSNCLRALTSLSLAGVPLAASSDRTLHALLSQTHSLTSLKLVVSMQEYDDQTGSNDREQIVTIAKSLEVIPMKTVTFLPLLSSLDVQIHNHGEPEDLRYFGSVRRFASMLRARWEGDDAVGLGRLRMCHFAVHAQHLKDVYRHTENFYLDLFHPEERLTFKNTFNALIDDGMDLAIWVSSELTQHLGGYSVVFAVPRKHIAGT